MDTDTVTTQAIATPQDAWVRWQREHADVLARGTGPQRVLLEAAMRFVAVIAGSRSCFASRLSSCCMRAWV